MGPSEEPRSEQGRGLTRKEFDEVIRRASELATRESDSGEGSLDEGELLRIAREVGLSERHVRMALAEVRSGVIVRTGGTMERIFGPETVRATRVVPGTPHELTVELDAFLVGGQLLQAVRKTDRMLQYRPAVDWASQVARVASATSRRYYVASARLVKVHLEEMEPGQTLVDFEVDPSIRGDAVGGAVAGVLAAAAVGFGGAIALTPLAPLGLAALGTAVAAVLGAGATAWAGSLHRRKLRDVLAEVEGILDRLETGETIEPPPPFWRRWVKRHFHGAAKDFLVNDP